MEKYTIETYEVQQIWVQQVQYILKGRIVPSHSKKCIVENVGEPVGPYTFSRDIATLHGLDPASISRVLAGKGEYVGDFKIYYDGTRTVELKVSNLEAVKKEMIVSRKHTAETIKQNLEIFGYQDVEIKEANGTNSIFTAKCMAENCKRKIERKYGAAITGKDKGCCKACEAVVKTAKKPKKYGEVSMFDIRPELLKYYKPELNNGKQANEISKGAINEITLCCDVCGNLSTHKPLNFSLESNGKFHCNYLCNYCNSLAVKFPEIAAEWDYDKNEGTPTDYAQKSVTQAWWKCEKGHEWETTIHSRATAGCGCPFCAGSNGEKAIEKFMKELNINFQSQYSVKINGSNRRFDFYLPDFELFIELHGLQHYEQVDFFNHDVNEQKRIDQEKQQYAEQKGHYICVDYREHDPKLAIERFSLQISTFFDKILQSA